MRPSDPFIGSTIGGDTSSFSSQNVNGRFSTHTVGAQRKTIDKHFSTLRLTVYKRQRLKRLFSEAKVGQTNPDPKLKSSVKNRLWGENRKKATHRAGGDLGAPRSSSVFTRGTSQVSTWSNGIFSAAVNCHYAGRQTKWRRRHARVHTHIHTHTHNRKTMGHLLRKTLFRRQDGNEGLKKANFNSGFFPFWEGKKEITLHCVTSLFC